MIFEEKNKAKNLCMWRADKLLLETCLRYKLFSGCYRFCNCKIYDSVTISFQWYEIKICFLVFLSYCLQFCVYKNLFGFNSRHKNYKFLVEFHVTLFSSVFRFDDEEVWKGWKLGGQWEEVR